MRCVLAICAILVMMASVSAIAAPNAKHSDSVANKTLFPKLIGRVVDEADLLSEEAEREITADLESLQRKNTNQVVVVTLESLRGRTIEKYSLMLGNHWGIGTKRRNNGVLLVVAPNERKVRIEAGLGLERTLTERLSQSIIDDQILPRLREHDFETGIKGGVNAIVRVLRGETAKSARSAANSMPVTSERALEQKRTWSKFMELDNSVVAYVDASSPKRDGELGQLWMMYDYKNSDSRIKSVTMLLQFVCSFTISKQVAVKALHASAFSKPMASGEVVDEDSIKEWQFSPPESLFASLAKLACDPQPAEEPSSSRSEIIDPSFDCAKATQPDEREICDDPRLAELDNTMAAGFNFVRLRYGRQKAVSVARPLLKLRQACGSDQGCIRQRQIDTVRTYQELGAPISLPEWADDEEPEKIYYGSRVGMTNTIVSKSGLDTTEAVIHTKHTRDDAITYCREYAGDFSQDCIKNDLASVPQNGTITANCHTGIFTHFWRGQHQFKGHHPNKDALAKYAVVNLSTGEVADGSAASGYPTMMGIFRALCPRTAPPEDDMFR